jgi:tetratricopeptide (TPR) repeat protein
MELSPSDPAIVNELAQAYLAAGTVYFNAKRSPEALAFMEKAARLREQEIAAKPESALVQRSLRLAYAAVGDINWGFPHSLGNRGVAIRNFEKMFRAATRLREQDPKSKSTAMDVAFSQMRYRSALEPSDPRSMEMLKASLLTLEELAAADAKNMGLRRQMIDLCLRTSERHIARGEMARAVGLSRRGIAISDEMADGDTKNVGARTWGVRTYLQLAGTLEKTGRKAESALLLRKAKIRLAEARTLDSAAAAPLAKPVAEWEARLR